MRSSIATMSLRTRLMLLVLLTVQPAFLLMGYNAWEERKVSVRNAQQQTTQLAQIVSKKQEQLIQQTRSLLVAIASVDVVNNPASIRGCSAAFARIRQDNPVYGNIGLVDPDGIPICSAVPHKPGMNFSDRAWYKRAKVTQGFSIGDYTIGRITGRPTIILAQPVKENSGKLRGYLFIALDLTWLQDTAASIDLPKGASIVVVDALGIIVTRYPDPENKWMGKPATENGTLKDMLSNGCRGHAEFVGQDGVARLHAIEPLMQAEEGCVYVRVGIPKAEVYGQIEQRFLRNMILLGIATLLAFALAWIGGDIFVVSKIAALSRAIGELARGNLAARTDLLHGKDELGQLSAGFDIMASDIERREARMAADDLELKRLNRAMMVLSTGNRAMLRAKDEYSLLNDICRMIVDKGGYPMVWVAYAEIGKETTLTLVAQANHGSQMVDEEFLRKVANSGIGKQALQDGQPHVALGSDNDAVLELSAAGTMGTADCLALPLSTGNQIIGLMCIYGAEADIFSSDEIDLLHEAASDLAYGIGNLRDQMRRHKAEEANRTKSEFLANMSHELRTPLNAVIGFSEVLKDGLLGELNPAQSEYVTDIFVAGRHLLSLINDILDLSKVEAGKMGLELEAVEVNALIEKSLTVVREKAQAQRVTLDMALAEDLPLVEVDVRKASQILYNLLSNAVKFIDGPGSVCVATQRVTRAQVENWQGIGAAVRMPLPEGDFAHYLKLSVQDTGIGIAPQDVHDLFKPFSQVDGSLSRRYEGTGLGLALVLKLAQLHGGTVAVNSVVGEGSCFTVWLPWRELPEIKASSGTLSPAYEGDQFALVVEDNDASAEVVRLQLESEGIGVQRVASAEEALLLLPTLKPTVIILDIQLPGMDGWSFLNQIKQSGSPWADLPVVIASIAADTKRGFALGAAQVLQKPVAREDMASTMHRLGLGLPGYAGNKILIVDDDPKAVELIAMHLAGTGLKVLRAFNGWDGIRAARNEHPDMIVLDLLMPDISGFEVVEELRLDEKTAQIPVIIVTAKTLDAAERLQLEGYVLATMEKGNFNHSRLVAEVRRALLAARQRRES